MVMMMVHDQPLWFLKAIGFLGTYYDRSTKQYEAEQKECKALDGNGDKFRPHDVKSRSSINDPLGEADKVT